LGLRIDALFGVTGLDSENNRLQAFEYNEAMQAGEYKQAVLYQKIRRITRVYLDPKNQLLTFAGLGN
jgi:hypothetical protein